VSPRVRARTRGSTAERCAWGLVGLAFALLLAAAVISASGGSSLGEFVSDVTGVGFVFSICFPVLGALVIRRRGGHLIGWLMLGMGISLAFHGFANRWAQTALVDDPGSLPLGDLASWFQAWAWMPGWLLATTLLPVVFPDGRPVGRHRVLAWVDGAAVAAVVIAIAAASWPVRGTLLLTASDGDPRLSTLDQLATVGFVVVGILTLVSMGSLLVRYRRATRDVRRQIAWVVYGAVIAALMSLIGAFLDVGGLFQTLEACALVGGLAVAMLRYRLYDIEVVVNRTLVYGALTATLAAIYLGSVLLLQLVLSGLTSDSGLAVAASTLGVAALFRPARARFQASVDRRFYRRKYDAARTLEAFSARLRDEVALGALNAELSAVIRETLQPAHVSLWLRSRGGSA
jgi:hypothetical protein